MTAIAAICLALCIPVATSALYFSRDRGETLFWIFVALGVGLILGSWISFFVP